MSSICQTSCLSHASVPIKLSDNSVGMTIQHDIPRHAGSLASCCGLRVAKEQSRCSISNRPVKRKMSHLASEGRVVCVRKGQHKANRDNSTPRTVQAFINPVQDALRPRHHDPGCTADLIGVSSN